MTLSLPADYRFPLTGMSGNPYRRDIRMSQRAGRLDAGDSPVDPCDGRPPVRVPGISLPARAAEVSGDRVVAFVVCFSSSFQVRQDGGRLLPRARCGSAARPDFLQHERSCVWSDAICCDVNNCDSHETFALDGCWIADRNCNSSRGEVNGRGLDRAQGSALLASRQPQNGHAKYRHYLSVIQCVCWCPSIFGVGEDECETKVVSRNPKPTSAP